MIDTKHSRSRQRCNYLGEGFGDVEGAAGAESESGIQRNVSDVAMENTTAGRAGT